MVDFEPREIGSIYVVEKRMGDYVSSLLGFLEWDMSTSSGLFTEEYSPVTRTEHCRNWKLQVMSRVQVYRLF